MANRDKYSSYISSDKEKENVWNNIIKTIHERRKKAKHYRYAVSAAAVLIFGITFSYQQYIKEHVYYAENRSFTVLLEDGTQVVLLPQSKLTTGKKLFSKIREVYLQGDAVFTVTKSKENPFIVYGNGFETRVLGTVFKISQESNQYKVDLYEGKIAVKNTENKDLEKHTEMVLAPNQSYIGMKNKGIVIVKNTTSKYSSLQQQMLQINLNNTSLADVSALLNENYNIKIEIPNQYLSKKISGQLKGNKPESILESIAFITNLKINKTDEGFILTE